MRRAPSYSRALRCLGDFPEMSMEDPIPVPTRFGRMWPAGGECIQPVPQTRRGTKMGRPHIQQRSRINAKVLRRCIRVEKLRVSLRLTGCRTAYRHFHRRQRCSTVALTDTQTHIDTNRYMQIHTLTAHTDTHIQKIDTQIHIDTHKDTHIHIETYTQTHADIYRHTQHTMCVLWSLHRCSTNSLNLDVKRWSLQCNSDSTTWLS